MESLTPLQERSCFRLEAGGLEELGKRGELRVTQFARWVNQLVPAPTARRKVVEINGHIGDIVHEGAQIELKNSGESMN